MLGKGWIANVLFLYGPHSRQVKLLLQSQHGDGEVSVNDLPPYIPPRHRSSLPTLQSGPELKENIYSNTVIRRPVELSQLLDYMDVHEENTTLFEEEYKV